MTLRTTVQKNKTISPYNKIPKLFHTKNKKPLKEFKSLAASMTQDETDVKELPHKLFKETSSAMYLSTTGT
jgi:hypothetical protein